MSAPMMPTTMSVNMPPPTAPGTIHRAIKPTMKPMMINQTIVVNMPLLYPLCDRPPSGRGTRNENQNERSGGGAHQASGTPLVKGGPVAEELINEGAYAPAHDTQQRIGADSGRIRNDVPRHDADEKPDEDLEQHRRYVPARPFVKAVGGRYARFFTIRAHHRQRSGTRRRTTRHGDREFDDRNERRQRSGCRGR